MVIRSPVSCVAPATPQALPQDDTHAHTRCLAHIRTQYSCREHGRGDRGRSYPVLLRDVSCCAARAARTIPPIHATSLHHARDTCSSTASHGAVYLGLRRVLARTRWKHLRIDANSLSQFRCSMLAGRPPLAHWP